MKRAYQIGNGWKRVKTASGFRYFRKGKPTSAKKFSAAAKRISTRRKFLAAEETRKLRKALKLKPFSKRRAQTKEKKQPPKITRPAKQLRKAQVPPFAFCRVKDREAFYKKVLEDRKQLREKLGEEEADEMRVIIDIDPTATKAARKKDRKGRGYRAFKSIKKLKRFLGLDYRYSEGELREPVDWTKKRGVCKFEKRANISLVKTRGDRIIGSKILKRYAIEQP